MPKWFLHRRVGKRKKKQYWGQRHFHVCFIGSKTPPAGLRGGGNGKFCSGSPLCHHAKRGMLRGRKAKKGNFRGVGWVGRIGSQRFQLGHPQGICFTASALSLHANWMLLKPRSPRRLKSLTIHHTSLEKDPSKAYKKWGWSSVATGNTPHKVSSNFRDPLAIPELHFRLP